VAQPRDRVIALLRFYAGLRLSELVAMDLADIQLSARKGLVIVRSGKGRKYREIPAHATLRDNLAIWIKDERPDWVGADTNPALLPSRATGSPHAQPTPSSTRSPTRPTCAPKPTGNEPSTNFSRTADQRL
jgi:site-specific recombinase XerC